MHAGIVGSSSSISKAAHMPPRNVRWTCRTELWTVTKKDQIHFVALFRSAHEPAQGNPARSEPKALPQPPHCRTHCEKWRSMPHVLDEEVPSGVFPKGVAATPRPQTSRTDQESCSKTSDMRTWRPRTSRLGTSTCCGPIVLTRAEPQATWLLLEKLHT